MVIDEHDEGHQQEQSPTWNARDVALERAMRAGVPCVLTSPIPTLEALDALPLVLMSRAEERAGWPIVDVVDRNREDPAARTHAMTPAVMRALGSGKRVVCVTNTTGQARLLACGKCSALARCERCHAAVGMIDDVLVCARCALVRPLVCAECASSRLKLLRRGTARLRAELEAAVGEAVVEVTARTAAAADGLPDARVYVGTEAALRQVREADVVAFLDFDGELLAPRYRAAEQSLALLALAARLVGGRTGGGRIIVQTTQPRHEVLDAVLHADPGRLVVGERARRVELGFPPAKALAAISSPGAAEFVAGLNGVELLGPANARWLVRAPNHGALADALAAVERPEERVRIEVDPLRV